MAPECLNKGQLTEKADIYAFGILVTEIVCGKNNGVFPQGSNLVLHNVRFTLTQALNNGVLSLMNFVSS